MSSVPVDTRNAKRRSILYALKDYCYDLNELVSQGVTRPVREWGDITQRTIEVLSRRTKRNPLLVGNPDDTLSVVEELVYRIHTGSVPAELKETRVFVVDSGKLMAGAKYRGDFEQRVEDLIREASEADNSFVLCFNALWLGGSEGYVPVADMLKFPLIAGEVQCIAAIVSDYLDYFRGQGILSRQFQDIIVTR